jgi:hypothetical protein
VLALALLLSAPISDVTGHHMAAVADAERAASDWDSLSPADQGVISGTVGRDDEAYWIRPLAGIPALVNSGQHFTARFASTGAEVAAGDSRWGLGLAAVGRGDALEAVPAAAPITEANRVSYRRGSVEEWYVNGPAGLEQGFTLGERPVGDPGRALTLALGSAESLTGKVDPGGSGLVLTRGSDSLAYRGLIVRDATGRTLPAHLELRGGRALVRVDDRAAQYPVTVDPFVQAAKLVASDGAAGDRFGYSMAISGSTVVVGAPVATVGTNTVQGAAYLFTAPTSPGGTLTQVAKLTSSDGAANDQFGFSVAVDGTTVVVGAPDTTVNGNSDQGAVYVFTQPAGGWAGPPTAPLNESAKLTASDGLSRNPIGVSVGISGGTVVTGAEAAKVGSNPQQGAGYVFVEPAGGWSGPQTQSAKLTASDGAANDELGASAAISGTTVVLGAFEAAVAGNAGQGAGYVFVQPAGGWAGLPTAPLHESAKLTASDGSEDAFLGVSVAVSGTTVVAGADQANVGPNFSAGAAYVFLAPSGGWSAPTVPPAAPVNVPETAKLVASDAGGGNMLGSAVGISGNVVVAGAPQAKIGANFSQGAGYVFVAPAGGWTGTAAAPQDETAKLTAADGATSAILGGSVAIWGTTVVAGASLGAVGGNAKQGAGYVFQPAPAATITTLGVAPASPAPGGSPETLTATITPAAAGTVQFMDGPSPLGAPVAVTGGTGTLTTTLSSGAHSLSAVFTPTDQTPLTGYTGSTSATISYTVNAKRPLCVRICS